MKRPATAADTLSLRIDISGQRLQVWEDGKLLGEYQVSTACKGVGEAENSFCTPRGAHEVAERIGAGCVPDTIFVGRKPTGEVYSPALRAAHAQRDWILTRILWLRGLEPGLNAGPGVDTYSRYIYIHGAPDDVPMGSPGSAGCIRMRNADVVELFDKVVVGTRVLIIG